MDKTGEPAGPDDRERRGGAWTALVVMVGVALFVYRDGLFSGGWRVVGSADTETYAFLWGFHWGAQSVFEDGAWPYWTHLLGFPDGGVLWLKEPLAVMAFAPILDLIGVPMAYQLTQVAHSVAGGMALYTLARHLGAGSLASLVGGLCFGFSPHTLGQAFNGNLESMNIAWLPLFTLATVVALTGGRRWAVAGVALSVFTLCVANQYYALSMALMTPALALVTVWHTHGRPGRAWIRPVGGFLAGVILGGAAFAPVGIRILASLRDPNSLTSSRHSGPVRIPHHSDIEHLWKPGDPPSRPPPRPPLPFRDPIYVGLGLMALGLLAPLLGPRGSPWRWVWPALGVGMSALTLGPVLVYDGEVVRSGGMIKALPWYYLMEDTPVLEYLTLPHRLTPAAGLCWSVAAALALGGLGRRGRWGRVGAGVLGAAAFVELLVYPPGSMPLDTVPLPRPVHTRLLAASAAPGAVVNLPMDAPGERPEHPLRIYWWYQTLHRRPVESSMLGQWPSILRQTPFFWKELRPLMSDRPEVGPPPKREWRDETGVQTLHDEGFGFVVLHLAHLQEADPDELARWQASLARNLGAGLALADGTVVFAVDTRHRGGLEAEAVAVLGRDQVLGSSEAFLDLFQGGVATQRGDRAAP